MNTANAASQNSKITRRDIDAMLQYLGEYVPGKISPAMQSLLDYERNGGRILFWACPSDCRGSLVNWTEKPAPPGAPRIHVATCSICGRTNEVKPIAPPVPFQSEQLGEFCPPERYEGIPLRIENDTASSRMNEITIEEWNKA